MAKHMGADLVIPGQVSGMEGQWLASVKLHDVRTAALLATARARGRAKLDVLDALEREVEPMVRKVSGSRAPAAGVTEGAIESSEVTSFGGGDWFFINPQFVSAAHRYRFPSSDWRSGQLGFRCARAP